MNDVNVEVREDRSHPEGGHAVISLVGLTSRPSSDAFLIEPADANLGTKDLRGWPAGERTPLKTRMSATGFEIMVGPDVVECPVLLPGTAVIVKVPAAGVAEEVLWPDITPLRRQKVKRIITSTDRRDALARINVQSPAKMDAGPQVVGTGAGAASSSDGDSSAGGLRVNTSNAASANEANTGFRLATAGTSNLGHGGTALSSLPGNTAKDGQRHSQASLARMQDSSATGVAQDGTLPAPATTTKSAPGSTPLAKGPPATGDHGAAGDTAGPPVFAPDGGPQGPVNSRGQAGRYAMLAMFFIAITSGFIGYYLSESGVASGYLGGKTEVAQTVAGDQQDAATLFDAFTTKPVSPRGNAADKVTLNEAIERAYSAVKGIGGARDTMEGAFWLRQYLTRQLGDEQTLWALTQLGSTYARPADSPPDYVTARQLWEIAAALGDPVASCFLGGVHETGLGVSVDKAKALGWYQRAKTLGGCRSLEAALARVR